MVIYHIWSLSPRSVRVLSIVLTSYMDKPTVGSDRGPGLFGLELTLSTGVPPKGCCATTWMPFSLQ